MADLIDSERGQLFLVTALAIAVASIALILLLNSAIYTQNVASRDLGANDRQAIAETQTFLDGAEGLLVAENERSQTQAERRTALRTGTERLAELQRTHELQEGTATGVRNLSLSDGYGLHQDSVGQFVNASGDRNWSGSGFVADSANGIRAFEIVVASADPPPTGDPVNESFRLDIAGNGGSGDVWTLYVFDDGGTNVSTKLTGGSMAGVCGPSTFATPVTINVTNASVNGNHCPSLAYWEDIDRPYDVDVTWGDRVSVTYDMTVNTTSIGSFNPPAADPYAQQKVYGVTGNYTYRSSHLYYVRPFRIAPGEPHGG